MEIKKQLKPTSAVVAATLLLMCTTSSAPASTSSKVKERDQTAEVEKQTTNLKTKLPRVDDKKPAQYILELQQSQALAPIGLAPVIPVELLDSKTSTTTEPSDSDEEETVPLVRPPLKALITVQRNLSPLSMDAKFSEQIGLSDVLTGSMAQNLGIENSLDGLKAQKYTYLSSLSKFLPDLKGGYSLIALNGSIPSSLFGISSGGSSSKLPSTINLLNAGFNYNAYQGGKVLFGALEQKHRLRASRAGLKTSVNDVLLDTAKGYYDLVLNEALLDIRTRAVEISNEQVRLNTIQEKAGTATGLDVLQSQSQLASDQQNLVDQQSNRRQSAIHLATLVNSSYSQDLISKDGDLKKKRVISKKIPIDKLLVIAVDNRPELKQYEELRLAAKRAIISASSPLQPKVTLGGSVYGVGSGSSNLSSIFSLNFGINWTLGALGTTDIANIQKARWEARQATVQAKQQFQSVFEQVHIAYDQSLAADSRIERASAQITAAEEELRIAKKRMEAGVGLNLDVLNAQRDLTQASINKARAIVDFNDAQAQLLHDVGLISVNSLTVGARL